MMYTKLYIFLCGAEKKSKYLKADRPSLIDFNLQRILTSFSRLFLFSWQVSLAIYIFVSARPDLCVWGPIDKMELLAFSSYSMSKK